MTSQDPFLPVGQYIDDEKAPETPSEEVESTEEATETQEDHNAPEETTEEATETDTSEVPEGSIKDVLKYVGDDKDKAQAALEVENSKGDDSRSTLVKKLEEILED